MLSESRVHSKIKRPVLQYFCRICFCLGVVLFIALFTQAPMVSAHAYSKPIHKAVPQGSGCTNSYCYVNPSLRDVCSTGWDTGYSVSYLETFYYTVTLGSEFCDQATWYGTAYTRSHSCSVFVFIPEYFATANVAYGVFNSSGSRIALPVINQNNVSGWVFLGGGTSWYGIDHIQISNNNGQMDQYLAAGRIEFLC